MFPRHLLPHRLPEIIPKPDSPVRSRLRQENSPAVLRHLHVIERRPTLRVHRNCSAQINFRRVEVARSQPMPPVQEFWLPMFQCPLQRSVRTQIHIVRNPVLVVRLHRYTRSQSNFAFDPFPKTFNAPCSPVAFGRMNTQFCQAESRPKIFVNKFSFPAKRKLASIPVSASGERLARSSIAIRISSSQSKSSGATVTSPASIAS